MAVSSETNAQLIEELLGSTLASIVKTQGMIASQIAQIIETIGFEPAQNGGPLKTRTFSFEFMRSEVAEGNDEIRRKKVTATLPLLSIVNLPSLVIDEANIDMSLRLVAHDPSPLPPRTSARLDPASSAQLPQARKLFVVAERPAQPVGSNDRSASMHVTIKLRQQPFPLGLDRLQSLLEDSGEQDEVDVTPK